MAVTLDLSNDYLVFDGNAAVAVYPAKTPELGSAWTQDTAHQKLIASARIEKINLVEVEPMAGVYYQADTRIRIPATLATIWNWTPKIGDMIQDASNAVWQILAVGLPRFNGSWSCFCRQLLMADGLCDKVTWLSTTYANVNGSKVATHASALAHIEARIQPMGDAEIDLQQRLGFDVGVKIVTATDLDVKFGDLLQDEASGGATYEIVSSVARKRLDVLSTYLCRVRP